MLPDILPSSLYDISMILIRVFGEPCFNGVIAVLYIVIGKIIADGKIGTKSIKVYGYGFVGSLLLLLLEYFYMRRYDFFAYTTDCLMFLAPTALFFALIVMNIHIQVPYAKMYRSMSTIIYCIHMPIYETLIIFVNKFGIPNPAGVTGFILTALIATLISIGILKLEKCKYLRVLQYTH